MEDPSADTKEEAIDDGHPWDSAEQLLEAAKATRERLNDIADMADSLRAFA